MEEIHSLEYPGNPVKEFRGSAYKAGNMRNRRLLVTEADSLSTYFSPEPEDCENDGDDP